MTLLLKDTREDTEYLRPVPSKKLGQQIALCMEHPESILFLDIETTGLSLYYDEITLVGWTLGGRSGTYIKGGCPKQMLEAVAASEIAVTYNGLRFDAKFMKQEFPDISFPEAHLDLMYMCRRVGLKGGQKAIEKELGVVVRDELEGVDGFAAVLLWHEYLAGNIDALRTLIRYNRADIAAMGHIFDHTLVRYNLQNDLFGVFTPLAEWAAPTDRECLPRDIQSAGADLVRAPTFRELFSGGPAENAKIVGIDLTGSEARATGWCLLDGTKAITDSISTDADILERTVSVKPDLVSIDSPLCLPKGRLTVFDDDPGRDEFGIMRQCGRELKRRGINVYPSLLPSMQKLTARGIKLANELRARGIPVIESYPGAAQDIMRIPRKGASEAWLKTGLSKFGISGPYETESVTHDELDAITSAVVGTFHMAGLAEPLGSESEPPLIIPKIGKPKNRQVFGLSGPLAAGKTTLGKKLSDRGFAYTRFSLVIDDIIRERGFEPSRATQQSVGAEINETGRQRELAERTIDKVAGAELIVVDGLRFPEDHAFMVETFGSDFTHIYVDAPLISRRNRYVARNHEDTKKFEDAAISSVEKCVPLLKDLADTVIDNRDPLRSLGPKLETLLLKKMKLAS